MCLVHVGKIDCVIAFPENVIASHFSLKSEILRLSGNPNTPFVFKIFITYRSTYNNFFHIFHMINFKKLYIK